MRVLSLRSDPPCLGVPDDIDWHGLSMVEHVGGPGEDVGLEDLECVPTAHGLVALFAGAVRVGNQYVWVPAGA